MEAWLGIYVDSAPQLHHRGTVVPLWSLRSGVLVSEALGNIYPVRFQQLRSRMRAGSEESWIFMKGNLRRILISINSYFRQQLGVCLLQSRIPDILRIARDVDRTELNKLVDLMLGCAITCKERRDHIERILGMQPQHKSEVMLRLRSLDLEMGVLQVNKLYRNPSMRDSVLLLYTSNSSLDQLKPITKQHLDTNNNSRRVKSNKNSNEKTINNNNNNNSSNNINNFNSKYNSRNNSNSKNIDHNNSNNNRNSNCNSKNNSSTNNANRNNNRDIDAKNSYHTDLRNSSELGYSSTEVKQVKEVCSPKENNIKEQTHVRRKKDYEAQGEMYKNHLMAKDQKGLKADYEKKEKANYLETSFDEEVPVTLSDGLPRPCGEPEPKYRSSEVCDVDAALACDVDAALAGGDVDAALAGDVDAALPCDVDAAMVGDVDAALAGDVDAALAGNDVDAALVSDDVDASLVSDDVDATLVSDDVDAAHAGDVDATLVSDDVDAALVGDDVAEETDSNISTQYADLELVVTKLEQRANELLNKDEIIQSLNTKIEKLQRGQQAAQKRTSGLVSKIVELRNLILALSAQVLQQGQDLDVAILRAEDTEALKNKIERLLQDNRQLVEENHLLKQRLENLEDGLRLKEALEAGPLTASLSLGRRDRDLDSTWMPDQECGASQCGSSGLGSSLSGYSTPTASRSPSPGAAASVRRGARSPTALAPWGSSALSPRPGSLRFDWRLYREVEREAGSLFDFVSDAAASRSTLVATDIEQVEEEAVSKERNVEVIERKGRTDLGRRLKNVMLLTAAFGAVHQAIQAENMLECMPM